MDRDRHFCESSNILVVLVNPRQRVRRCGLEDGAEVLSIAAAHLLCQGPEQRDREVGQRRAVLVTTPRAATKIWPYAWPAVIAAPTNPRFCRQREHVEEDRFMRVDQLPRLQRRLLRDVNMPRRPCP